MTSRRKCRRCGAQLAVGKPFCSRCGTYQPLFPDRGLSGVTTRGNNPGWFKDPFGRAAYRYWDGQIWSERVYTAEYGTDVFSIDTLKDEQVPDGVWRATFGSLAVSLGGLIVAFVLSFCSCSRCCCSVIQVVRSPSLSHRRRDYGPDFSERVGSRVAATEPAASKATTASDSGGSIF